MLFDHSFSIAVKHLSITIHMNAEWMPNILCELCHFNLSVTDVVSLVLLNQTFVVLGTVFKERDLNGVVVILLLKWW